MSSDPVIKMASTGSPAVINYQVPEATSYSGRHLIDLSIELSKFKEAAFKVPDLESTDDAGSNDSADGSLVRVGWDTPGGVHVSTIPSLFSENVATAADEIAAASDLGIESLSALELVGQNFWLDWTWWKEDGKYRVSASGPIDPTTAEFSVDFVARQLQLGYQPIVSKNSAGELSLRFVQPTVYAMAKIPAVFRNQRSRPAVFRLMSNPIDALSENALTSEPVDEEVIPQILIVEEYRLSTFLDDYGAGRTVQTFSLLPGESTTITIRTFNSQEDTAEASSSIFDSWTSTSEKEFLSTVETENTNQSSLEKSKSYYADADAKANWGWGSASVSGGVSGSANAARQEFSSNVQSATDKHAQTASAQRDITVDTTSSTTSITETESTITREIKNINVGRTLNFAFRQLNQELRTVLHLTNVRVAFFNGYHQTRREVPLYELDSLLDAYITDAETVTQIRDYIIKEYSHVFDYEGRPRRFVESASLLSDGGDAIAEFLRVIPGSQSDIEGDVVKGIAVGVTENVVRTQGVIVEALLGQAEALDEYTKGLQEQAVAEKANANGRARLENQVRSEALKILRDGDSSRIELLQATAELFALIASTKNCDEHEMDSWCQRV